MSTDYPPASSSQHELRGTEPEYVSHDFADAPSPRRRFQHRYWVHALWLLATILCTTYVGWGHYISFLSQLGRIDIRQVADQPLVTGFWYSGTLLLILGAHELGHYLMCRYHQVDASLPYFIPVPPLYSFLAMVGTLGAFIRIREQFPNRRVLFDVGVAGPLAGLVLLVPLLFVGLRLSNLTPMPSDFVGVSLGEPLLFKGATYLVWGRIPEGLVLNMHPMVFAAWFGLLATALNLMPFGQLDGGHIAYAWLKDRSRYISIFTVATVTVLSFLSASWVIWTAIMLAMLLAFGPNHPPAIDENTDLDMKRQILAVVAFIFFALCFMPIPIEPLGFR